MHWFGKEPYNVCHEANPPLYILIAHDTGTKINLYYRKQYFQKKITIKRTMRMGKRGNFICGLVEHPVGVLSFTNILQSTRYLFHLMNTFLLQIAWENPLFLFTDSTCMQNSIYTLIFIGIQDKSFANLCLVFV